MSNYPIFSVLGIEIEYMLVDKDTLSVKPQSDIILNLIAGELVNEVSLGDIAVSNELVMHVIELKNDGPKPATAPVAKQFHQALFDLQKHLTPLNLQLLPSGAHPWMNPMIETVRWPHGNNDIYQQYDAIFNCQGHGWANLQSMHVNLPFANDEEFSALHNGIRLILPLLPALAGSTPILDGKPTGLLDSRLDFYSKNQQKIPSISGEIIPEFITSRKQYEQYILQPMYQEISAYDKQGLLQFEWLNSRGAIAKFDYSAIEIRIIDSQECVQADIAIAHFSHAILKYWYERKEIYLENPIPTSRLKPIYDAAIIEGLDVIVDDMEVLKQWQLPQHPMTLKEAWSYLYDKVAHQLEPTSQQALEHILNHGNLSNRILSACHDDFSPKKLKEVYHRLGDCLIKNELF